jgi:hypothetical protein
MWAVCSGHTQKEFLESMLTNSNTSINTLRSSSAWDERILTSTADPEYADYTASEPYKPQVSSSSPIIPILLGNSVSSDWSMAKHEWKLTGIHLNERKDPQAYCECGHPIREICMVENVCNGNILDLGNCCVNVIQADTSKVFQALKDQRINAELIAYAAQQGIINDWEVKFLQNVWRKRRLSPKQEATMDQLKPKIFSNEIV